MEFIKNGAECYVTCGKCRNAYQTHRIKCKNKQSKRVGHKTSRGY